MSPQGVSHRGSSRDRVSRALLACAALIACAVGSALAFFPVQFRQSYGVPTELDAAVLSETRAPGGALIALGLLMAGGSAVKAWRAAGLGVAVATFSGYGLARLLSIVLDGVPSSDLLGATAVEVSFGVLAAFVLIREGRGASTRDAS